jgi:hypothetical protein
MKTISLLLTLFCLHSLECQAWKGPLRISKSTSTDPNEVTLAINPANPSRMLACANFNYRYYSNDSAKTWSEGYTGTTTGSSGDHGDPVLTFDSKGNIYRAHLIVAFNCIGIQKSTDGGINWATKGCIGLKGTDIEDKPWLVCDQWSSKYKNNLYVAWSEFYTYGSLFNQKLNTKIRFSRSTDSGSTWSKPIDIIPFDTSTSADKDENDFGTSIAIGDSGEIFLSWPGKRGIQFSRSLDGGISFSKPLHIAGMPNGGLDLSIPGMIRYYSFPVLAYDHSTSAYHGRLYLAWADQRNGSSNTDIFMCTSPDTGHTWSSPARVNTDKSNRHQFMPAISVDPGTGYIYVLYYDRRNYNDNRTELYISKSTDGAASFKDTGVSRRPFSLPTSPSGSNFIGDYISIQAVDGQVYSIWTEDSNANRSVWLGSYRDTVISHVVTGISSPEVAEPFTVLQNYPNPCNDFTSIAYSLPEGITEAELIFMNIAGEVVYRHSIHNNSGCCTTDISKWKVGVYFYTVKAGGMQSIARKLIKE